MAKKDVASLIADLKNKKPKKRIQACQELAKLGDPQAIPSLASTYKKDPDDKVKAAAEKALTKFKAMQPDGAKVAKPVSPGIKRLRILLGISFVILLIANIAFMVLGGSGDDDEEIVDTTLRDRTELVDRIETSLTDAQEGALAIQEETENLDCERSIKRPSKVKLSAMEKHVFPDLAAVVDSDQYGTVFEFLGDAYTVWKNNCDNGSLNDIGTKITVSDMANLVLDNIPGLLTEIQTARTEPAATRDPEMFGVPPTAAPTPTFTPAPTPTQTPIAGIEYPTHIAALDSLVNKLDPAITEFQGRWQDAIDGEDFIDCRISSYGIDPLEAYVLPPEQAGDENLDEAVRLINEALALTQSNLPEFAAQCVLDGGLLSVVDTRLPELNTAAENIAEAKIRLDSMRNR